jgi:hypothetical protein
MDWEWRGLAYSPANRYDNIMLELSRAWNLQTVHELHQKVKEKCPELVFLMETKLQSNKMNDIKQRLGFENMIVVDNVGRSGGLALLLKNKAGVEIHNYNSHIHAKVEKANTTPWAFTGFYGHPEAHKRYERGNF